MNKKIVLALSIAIIWVALVGFLLFRDTVEAAPELRVNGQLQGAVSVNVDEESVNIDLEQGRIQMIIYAENDYDESVTLVRAHTEFFDGRHWRRVETISNDLELTVEPDVVQSSEIALIWAGGNPFADHQDLIRKRFVFVADGMDYETDGHEVIVEFDL